MGQALRNKQIEAVYGQVCSSCGGVRDVVNEGLPEDLQKEAERIAGGLYDGTIVDGEIDPAMTRLVAGELRKAVIEGFGRDFPNVNFGTPDYKMLASLERNVFHFSGAENYQMLKSMSLALLSTEGSLRSYSDFKKEASKIAGVYLGKNLRTEYELAVASSQMASKWVDFEKNETAAPWLRYDTVGDSRVRPEHRKLNGVIKKVNDDFWNVYYPPNGWMCRCDVTQLVMGADTNSGNIQLPNDVPVMFQTNMAKEGLAYPDKHPYYQGLPEALKRQAAALRSPQYSPAYPAEGNTKTGGAVQISSMADPVDLPYNLEHAIKLAELGEQVRIRPHFNEVRIKNPELELQGKQVGDFKQPKVMSRNSYEKNIRRTADQKAQIPVFVVTDQTYSKPLFIRALDNKKLWENASSITEVWILRDEQLIKITREEIALKSYYGRLPE